MLLTSKDKGVLLLCARESLKGLFSDNTPPTIDYQFYPDLVKQYGAFVTLTKNDELRGCIGYIYSEDPLFEVIKEVSKLAATEDPRFPPVSENELSQILIEISVLSKPQPLNDYKDIEIGVHGLLLEEPNARGVLLPQVAVEHSMDVSGFLTSLCRKANLPPNKWMSEKLNIKTFTADVFGEQKRIDLTGERN